jgi:hypothetical protein
MAGGQFYRRKFSGTAQPLQSPEWTRLLNDARETLHLRSAVTLLQSPDNVMPMTWGWWRPVVLLPAEAAQWPDERRRVVLLHELAHVKRRDYLTQIAAQLVCALYWFNPLVWFAARQMCIEREAACDDLVLSGGCKASDYAGHLVEVAASFQRVPQMAAIAMARSTQLQGRIAAIVDASRNRRLRTSAAVVILVLIAGIAVCLGGSGTDGSSDTGKSDALRQQQIEQLKAFSLEKEKQSQALAAAAGETISPEFHRYFDAATSGDWQTVTNMYESFKQRHPQYSHPHGHGDASLRTSYWGPVLEISLAYDQVMRCEPAYTQMAVDGILNSIPPGSIYFGGTDPGRGLPTAFCKSQVDADPFYTLTQNALADGTYLEYLDRTYGQQRSLLKQMAEACRKDSELQKINAMISTNELDRINKLDHLNQELPISKALLAAEEKKGDSESILTNINKLQRIIKVQQANIDYFEGLSAALKEPRDKRVKEILAEQQKKAGNQFTAGEEQSGLKTIYIPTAEDSQRCFQDYIEDAQRRLANHLLKPGENVTNSDGRTQVSGQVAVMEINGRLAKIIFDKNAGHEFFIEESFPLDWMAPYLEPHGLIMKINQEPLPEISDAKVQQDREYWQSRVTQMIGGWLDDKTPVKKVTVFAERVFQQHDLGGFSGDPRFVQNDYAVRMFSKWRASIAGLYAWHAENDAADADKERMADAADFAFRQAIALCPYSTETAARYTKFLKQQHREADATLVEAMAKQFKTADALPRKASVFQIRLALDVPTDNTEPMRLQSQKGVTGSAEPLYVAKEILLDHKAVQSATFDKNSRGYPEIEVSFTDAGRKQFAEITRQHMHQRLAIVIDGKLWMAPVVQAEIIEG